jgi:hypothetical protein
MFSRFRSDTSDTFFVVNGGHSRSWQATGSKWSKCLKPAKTQAMVTKREKRTCRSCEDLGVVSAPYRDGSLISAWRVTGLRRFAQSWKAAVGCKSRCAITFPRFSPGSPISRPGASQSLLPLCGSLGISSRLRKNSI